MTYSVIGDDTGPTFFRINEQSGAVLVKEGMKQDTETQYQVLHLSSNHFRILNVRQKCPQNE